MSARDDEDREIERRGRDAAAARRTRSSFGIVAGPAGAASGLFVATNWLVLKGGAPVVGPHLALLGQFFIGYRSRSLGSLIGFAWAFACGFVARLRRSVALQPRGRPPRARRTRVTGPPCSRSSCPCATIPSACGACLESLGASTLRRRTR